MKQAVIRLATERPRLVYVVGRKNLIRTLVMAIMRCLEVAPENRTAL